MFITESIFTPSSVSGQNMFANSKTSACFSEHFAFSCGLFATHPVCKGRYAPFGHVPLPPLDSRKSCNTV